MFKGTTICMGIYIDLNLRLFLQMFIQREHIKRHAIPRNMCRMGGTILKRHAIPRIPKIPAN